MYFIIKIFFLELSHYFPFISEDLYELNHRNIFLKLKMNMSRSSFKKEIALEILSNAN